MMPVFEFSEVLEIFFNEAIKENGISSWHVNGGENFTELTI